MLVVDCIFLDLVCCNEYGGKIVVIFDCEFNVVILEKLLFEKGK